MEHNEISMLMDVKLDIYEKRPDSLKFKTWTKTQTKIEAIKCLPCFLRITLTRCEDIAKLDATATADQHKSFVVSINVPGVSVSLASSRTKQHSYGLFWTQNRRDCLIYFSLETEANCRRHMKWLKKSIKNLELHRQLFLEQRRSSRGPSRMPSVMLAEKTRDAQQRAAEMKTISSIKASLGPLPEIPKSFDGNNSTWSRRVSRASEIYEEIFEGSERTQGPRLSRRFSRSSIASGIYEEMKPTANNFNVIVEETPPDGALPPPLPPLPPPRKRINTFETEVTGLLGEIPRSNTNPESELAKKKKYRNVLDNLFGGVGISARGKRAESVSETQACSVEELIECKTPPRSEHKETIYANDEVTAKRSKQQSKLAALHIANAKRNSFSSPDLSKINFLDTFDEERIAEIMQNSYLPSDDLGLSNESLDASPILPIQGAQLALLLQAKPKADSLESLNISQQIPSNFNFSACNSSSINLIGSSGAALPSINAHKSNVVIDDVTGYCFMAPIKQKPNNAVTHLKPATSTGSTTSGYSTGSYCSSTSSRTNSTEDRLTQPPQEIKTETQVQRNEKEESTIYENMQAGSLNSSAATVSPSNKIDFIGNLYENLRCAKSARELEQHSPALVVMSTSTPTESPLCAAESPVTAAIDENVSGKVEEPKEEEEDYYQTPRKSIISVDDKIPSYYPNSCESVKMRRQSPKSPLQGSPISSTNEKTNNAIGLRNLVSMKMRRERKENLYIKSPQKVAEQRNTTATSPATTTTTSSSSTQAALSQKPSKTQKTKKTAVALKVAEHVYTVAGKKIYKKQQQQQSQPFTDEMKEKLQTELLQLALLQKIDFKFDDAKGAETTAAAVEHVEGSENWRKYATVSMSPQRTTPQHHLQLNQAENTKAQTPTCSDAAATTGGQNKLLTPLGVGHGGTSDLQLSGSSGGSKKFASLPRFKKIDFSPLKLRINNVLQRSSQQQEF